MLVSTEVLQEGEDLHTFCDRVFHYGIAWTPSALEQRTGRVDRVGSLAERRLASLTAVPLADGDKIQVYFPYLQDTVEVVQNHRLFERMNTFLRLMHDGLGAGAQEPESRTDAVAGVLSERGCLKPITGLLRSR